MSARAETKRRAFAAASAEIEATCSRLELTAQERLDLVAEVSARIAFDIAGCVSNNSNSFGLILRELQLNALSRLNRLIGTNPLRASCPVTPLGVRDGHYVFLDAVGQVQTLGERMLASRHVLLGLFSGDDWWLRQSFPKWALCSRKTCDGSTIRENRIVDFQISHAVIWLQKQCRDLSPVPRDKAH